jgi:hypothetical protein
MESDPTTRPPSGSTRRPVALAFFIGAAVLFFAVDLAADLVARVSIRGETLGFAARDHLHYVGVQLAGTGFLSLPFLGLAFIGLPVLRARGPMAGVLFLLLGALLLGGVYALGYRQAAEAMAARHWTAAALSVAFIPVMSLPVLVVAFIARRFAWDRRASKGDA